MSIYTTPLQFGYFFAFLFSFLFWIRGYREERFSDILLGFIMFFLAMEIQDYTFGFAGINYLWEEMNGFPRYFGFAFAPTIYFYLKAQINRNFRFGIKEYAQYLPYFVYFIINFCIFLCGADYINNFDESRIGYMIGYLEKIAFYIIFISYFYLSLKLYKSYRDWAETEYSDVETISFNWLRNFIYLIIAGQLFKFIWFIIDIAFGDLPYSQDWWWHLLTVYIICYVGIRGYAQKQPQKIQFNESKNTTEPIFNTNSNAEALKISSFQNEINDSEIEQIKTMDYHFYKTKLDSIFSTDKIYLDPELSLSELSRKLKSNNSVISAAINSIYSKNFNEFVNEFRVNEFVEQVKNPSNNHLTLLAIAIECGFNSKATFNRAVKKVTGKSPKEIHDESKKL